MLLFYFIKVRSFPYYMFILSVSFQFLIDGAVIDEIPFSDMLNCITEK